MKKPFFYAFGAVLYIVSLVSIASATARFIPAEDSIIAPMVMLSLLVLSVSVMGFLFLSQPILLYVEGQKKEAINFFMKTVGIFAIFVIILASLLLLI